MACAPTVHISLRLNEDNGSMNIQNSCPSFMLPTEAWKRKLEKPKPKAESGPIPLDSNLTKSTKSTRLKTKRPVKTIPQKQISLIEEASRLVRPTENSTLKISSHENVLLSTVTEGTCSWGSHWGLRDRKAADWVGPVSENSKPCCYVDPCLEEELTKFRKPITDYVNEWPKKSTHQQSTNKENESEFLEEQLRSIKIRESLKKQIAHHRKLKRDGIEAEENRVMELERLVDTLPDVYRQAVDIAMIQNSVGYQEPTEEPTMPPPKKHPVFLDLYHEPSFEKHIERLRKIQNEREAFAEIEQRRAQGASWSAINTIPEPFNLSCSNLNHQSMNETPNSSIEAIKKKQKSKRHHKLEIDDFEEHCICSQVINNSISETVTTTHKFVSTRSLRRSEIANEQVSFFKSKGELDSFFKSKDELDSFFKTARSSQP